MQTDPDINYTEYDLCDVSICTAVLIYDFPALSEKVIDLLHIVLRKT